MEKHREAKAGAIRKNITLELEQVHKNGSIVWTEVSITPLFDHENRLETILGIARDITERKEAEALRLAKEAAETSNLAKSQFLARISHEIRTPMNSILGMLRLAILSDLPQKQQERIQVAKSSAESLLSLLNDLLDLSSIEAGKLSLHEKEIPTHNFLNEVAKAMELLAAEKGLDLYLSCDSQLPRSLIGDPYRLKQILINLLNNAIKYTDKGWISLEAGLSGTSPAEDSTGRTSNLLFVIRDTGRGINAENLKNIFELYEQGSQLSFSNEQGIGLGLAICRKITEKMNGSLWAQSEPGQGSVFFLQIPFKTNHGGISSTEALFSDPEAWEDLPPLRILLVEDQRMNQIFTTDLLTSQGHSVEVAEDGLQALAMLGQKSYDMVLMDIKMPGMDGIEATKRIRSADPLFMDPDIPVIGLSAHAVSEEEMDTFQNSGFNDYVIKPVNFEKLFAAMKKALC
ncbi:MAG: response regulator [Desulfohalobiaceae bacterium]|nr:response regulator [Desulfohalobiaceae bacterium]